MNGFKEPFQQYLSYQTWYDNYKWETDETIYDTWRRVAKAISVIEDNKKYWEEKYYELLKDFKYIPGGRILSNAGTGLKNTCMINCFASGFEGKHQDSIDSIYTELHRQANILRAEGGYGFNCDVLRPRGSYIKGVGVESPGAVKLLDLWDTSASTITAGNYNLKKQKGKNKIRKGAQMVLMSIWHPSIEEFITIKQTPGKLTKFNMSVLITDDFMKAVKKHKSWKLIFPDTTFEKYDAEWDGDIYKWQEKNYPIIEYKYFEDASELWDLIMKSSYDRNEPGVIFIDTANKLNNLKLIEGKLKTCNACFSGNTKILTEDGYKYIKDLENKEVNFINEQGNISKGKVWKNGIKDTIVLKLSNKKEICCTPDHVFKTLDGKEIQAKNLKKLRLLQYIDKSQQHDNLIKQKSPMVINIIQGKKIEVYDFSEPQLNWGVVEGCIVHNCSEQILPIGGSCNLGSINLTQYINNEKTDYDYEKLKDDIPIMVRFQDAIIDITNYPLKEQKQEASNKRRIGIGVLGFASSLYLLKIPYGSKRSLHLAEKLNKFRINELYKTSSDLALEKGIFPLYDKNKYLQSDFINNILNEETIELIKKQGIRNSHLTSIQPTGNTSCLSNNISSGIEPIIDYKYIRTVIETNKPENLELPKNIDWNNKLCEKNNDWKWITEGDEFILKKEYIHNNKNIIFKIDKSRGLCREEEVYDYAILNMNDFDEKADYAKTLFDLTIDDHLKILEIFAKYTCSSVSKTINIQNDYPYENFKDVYIKAYDTGIIKGLTTYRWGTMASVLSSKRIELNNIVKIRSIRPIVIPCNIYKITVGGEKWIIFVGLDEGKPIEVFAGKIDLIDLPSKIDSGSIRRIKSGVYQFEYDNEILIKDISKIFESGAQESLTRLMSLALQFDIPVSYIVEQLGKSGGNVTDFNKSISRAFKKFLKGEEREIDANCPSCGGKLLYIEGCYKCKNICGWEKCD